MLGLFYYLSNQSIIILEQHHDGRRAVHHTVSNHLLSNIVRQAGCGSGESSGMAK
jgi:hypothetical protein